MPNTSPSTITTGCRSELSTYKFLLRTGWTELVHDVECAGVQIDLIGRAPSGVLAVIEVKTEAFPGTARLNHAQARRLRRAAARLSEAEPVQMVLALVGPDKTRLLPVDALTPF